MADMVNWGILGAAKIAREWVAPAIHQSARGRVAAIASLTPGKAEALAAPYGDVTIHEDYEDLLADPAVDAVYIPLPNSDHVPWTRAALAAGKHVLCEKPIALEAEEITGLIETRDATGLVAAEAFMVAHHPQWARVRSLIEGGAIGRLVQVQGAFSFYNDDPQNIRNRPEQGGGALRDIGVYPCITTRLATGEEPLSVTQARIDWQNGIDATAWVQAEFPGFMLDFYVSMRMANRQQMAFHGTQGVLTVETPFNAQLYGDAVISLRQGNGITLERFPGAEQYRHQIDAFNASVLDGVPFACPLEYSLGNQRLIDMIYEAANPAP
ncbi:Gfo/Idh/MocA family oxidoreductase [Halovulum dunhuangense]|uniref:Gfo/Idh/MocA family oxidoreductase n=1 Tax=Halovulum dunhuangense TaxID=1505036 RepID=A0A849L559_9RHOB|nr:Gfo/Idh/MocA family oxidoreductase [Halovulum dunhuangense]NNU81499.1 Gfo/Idh/MocA family oxidoreductase [Halovulum dunhuangense]